MQSAQVPLGHKSVDLRLSNLAGHSEVEQLHHLVLLSQFNVYLLLFELVEEGVQQCLVGRDSAGWTVPQHAVQQIVELFSQVFLLQDLHKRVGTFFQLRGLILGNWYFSISQSGFISMISSWEGVPMTLMISTSWSMLLSDRKIGCSVTISTRMQPADHMSICVLQAVLPKISSGALQQREQMQARLGSPSCSFLAEPKSQIIRLQVASLTSTFCGFMSLWAMEMEERQSSPRNSWQAQALSLRREMSWRWYFWMDSQRLLGKQSITTFRYSLSPSQVQKESFIFNTLGWFRHFKISNSLFLYFLSWNTLLIATTSSVFLSRALWTIPKVPFPTLSSKAYLQAPTSRADWLPSFSSLLCTEWEVAETELSFLLAANILSIAWRCAWVRRSLSRTSVLSLVVGLRAMDLMGRFLLSGRESASLTIVLFSARGALVLFIQKLIFLAFSLASVLILRVGTGSSLGLTLSLRFPIISTAILYQLISQIIHPCRRLTLHDSTSAGLLVLIWLQYLLVIFHQCMMTDQTKRSCIQFSCQMKRYFQSSACQAIEMRVGTVRHNIPSINYNTQMPTNHRRLHHRTVPELTKAILASCGEPQYSFQQQLEQIVRCAGGADNEKGLLSTRSEYYLGNPPGSWVAEYLKLMELLAPAGELMKRVIGSADSPVYIEPRQIPKVVADSFTERSSTQSRIWPQLRRDASGSYNVNLWEWFWGSLITGFMGMSQLDERHRSLDEEEQQDELFTELSRNIYLVLVRTTIKYLRKSNMFHLQERLISTVHLYMIEELMHKFKKESCKRGEVRYGLRSHYFSMVYVLLSSQQGQASDDTLTLYYDFIRVAAENYSSIAVPTANHNIRNLMRLWIYITTRRFSLETLLLQDLERANFKEGWFRLGRSSLQEYRSMLKTAKLTYREVEHSQHIYKHVILLLRKFSEWTPSYSFLAVYHRFFLFSQLLNKYLRKPHNVDQDAHNRIASRLLTKLAQRYGDDIRPNLYLQSFNEDYRKVYSKEVELGIEKSGVMLEGVSLCKRNEQKGMNSQQGKERSVWEYPLQQNELYILFLMLLWVAQKMEGVAGHKQRQYPLINVRILSNPSVFFGILIALALIVKYQFH